MGFGGELEEDEDHGSRAMDMCAAEMTTPFKPLIVKGLVQPVKDQKVVMNDGRFVPMKPPKYQNYSFDLTKVAEIYEELVRAKVIIPDSAKNLPKPDELRGKKYCKLHYTFNHSITNCVQFRDWIQDLIVKGKLLLEKPQANMMIDTDPFPEAPINMVQFKVGRYKGKGNHLGEKSRIKVQEETPRLPEKSKSNFNKGSNFDKLLKQKTEKFLHKKSTKEF